MKVDRYDSKTITPRVLSGIVQFYNNNTTDGKISISTIDNLMQLGALCCIGSKLETMMFVSIYFVVRKSDDSSVINGFQPQIRTPISVRTPVGPINPQNVLRRYRYIVYLCAIDQCTVEYPETVIDADIHVITGGSDSAYTIHSRDQLIDGYQWKTDQYISTLTYYNAPVASVLICGKVEQHKYVGCILKMNIIETSHTSHILKCLGYLANHLGYHHIVLPQTPSVPNLPQIPLNTLQKYDIHSTFDISDTNYTLPWIIV